MGRTVEHIKIVEEDLRSPRIFQAVYGMSEGFFLDVSNLQIKFTHVYVWELFFCTGSFVVRNCTAIPKMQSASVNVALEFMEERFVIPIYSATPGRSPAAEEPHTIAEVRIITGRIYFTASTPTISPAIMLIKNWISPSNENNVPAALNAKVKHRMKIPIR